MEAESAMVAAVHGRLCPKAVWPWNCRGSGTDERDRGPVVSVPAGDE